MNSIFSQRAVELGEYIASTGATVRLTASKFSISKSTVHKDVSERLKTINPTLYQKVRRVLDTNKEERHIRGGIATKEKYAIKLSSSDNKKQTE